METSEHSYIQRWVNIKNRGVDMKYGLLFELKIIDHKN